jgi:hypothetical protein
VESSNLGKKTVIVFTSDHGEEFFEHKFLGHGLAPYQDQIHIPLIFFSPKLISNSKEKRKVESIDIMPTILDFLNITYENYEGKSLIKENFSEFVFSGLANDKRTVIKQNLKVIVDSNETHIVTCNNLKLDTRSYLKELFNMSNVSDVYPIIKNYEKSLVDSQPNDFREPVTKFDDYVSSKLIENNCTLNDSYSEVVLLYNLTDDPYEQKPLDNPLTAKLLLDEFDKLEKRNKFKTHVVDSYPNLLADQLKSLGYTN